MGKKGNWITRPIRGTQLMIPWYALESLPSKRSNPLLNARNAKLDAEVTALPKPETS